MSPCSRHEHWRRNLQAAGTGVLQVDGVRHTITAPEIVAADDLPDLTAWWRALSRLYAIREWLVVTTVSEPPSVAAAVPTPSTAQEPSVPVAP